MSNVRPRFEILDCLRGFAALSVVWFHSFRDGSIFPSGALAVDLFFILSGYVIALTYGERVLQNRSDFLLSRFIRLYPMLFFGAVGGIAVAVAHALANPAGRDYPAIAASGFLSMVALPYLVPDKLGEAAFGLNPPIWSLFFEIIANVIYALFARYLSTRVLLIIVVSGLVGIVAFGTLGGGGKGAMLPGIPRVSAGFFGGILLFRLWKMTALPKIQMPAWALVAVLFGLFMLPNGTIGFQIIFSYTALFFVVICAINGEIRKSDKLLLFLGAVSYPVYLVHWLTLLIFSYLGSKMGLSGDRYIFIAILHLVSVPAIGWLVMKYYEGPARMLLGRLRMLRGRKLMADA